MRLLIYSHKNNIKTFWYYSHNILTRLLRSKKNRRNICYFWRQPIENEWANKIWWTFELDKTVEKDRRVVHRVIASVNEWQRVVQQVTTNYNEWQRVIQQKYFSDHCFCYWWFLLFCINKYPIINILSTASIFFVGLFSNFSFKGNTEFLFSSKMWYLRSSGSLVGTHEIKNFNPIK